MAKDASFFISLSKTKEENIFVVDDYAVTIEGCGEVYCNNGVITDVYHVRRVSANLLSVPLRNI